MQFLKLATAILAAQSLLWENSAHETPHVLPVITLTHPLVKIRSDTPLSSVSSISLAGNEYESFQIAIDVTDSNATVTNISVDLPKSAGFQVLTHRIRYVNVENVSNCEGATGLWPDALVPDVDPWFHEKRNAFPAVVSQGARQAFWVDLFADGNLTTPGVYAATVTIRFAAHLPKHINLTILRRNFSLPSTSKRYQTAYGCSTNGILAGRFGDQKPSYRSPEELANMQRQYVELGLMHRISFSDFLKVEEFSKMALSPKQPLGNWSAVDDRWGDLLGDVGVDLPFGLRNTRPTAVQLPNVHFPGPPQGGINRTLIDHLWHATGCPAPTPGWGYTYWPTRLDYGVSDMLVYCQHSQAGDSDAWARTCGPLPPGTECTLQPVPSAANVTHNSTEAILYWRAAANHSRTRGWFDRAFDYTCDEPGAFPLRYHTCLERARALHAADPELKVMITAEKTATDATAGPKGNLSAMIDVWTPIINFMESSRALCPHYPPWVSGNERHTYDALVAQGKRLWWYQSCMSEGCSSAVQPAHGSHPPGCDPSETCVNGTWPSMMIDTEATFNRVMPWMSHHYDIHGELYWSVNAADTAYNGHDGVSSWERQWLAGGNGDGSLTYPGRVDKIGGSHFVPIASMRLKLVRDGLEDLEYMFLLDHLSGSRKTASAIVDTVVTSAYDFDHDPMNMLRAREAIAQKIESLM